MITGVKILCSSLKLLLHRFSFKISKTKHKNYIIQPSAMFGNLINEIIWVNKYYKKLNYLGICAQAGSYNPYICEIFGKQGDMIHNPYFSFNYQQRKIQFGDKTYYLKLLKKYYKLSKPIWYYDLFFKNEREKDSGKTIFYINKKYWGIENKNLRIQFIKKIYKKYAQQIEEVTPSNKKCVVYLRQKNYKSSEEKIRNGSSLENYKSLFKKYPNISFFCLGDHLFQELFSQPNVYYSGKLNIPDQLFSLIIWYFCSLFVLEPGGPTCFPILLGRSFLLLNYPWFDIPIPGALITYKNIKIDKSTKSKKLPDWNGGIQYFERLAESGVQLEANDGAIIADSFKEYLNLNPTKPSPDFCVSIAWKKRYQKLNIRTNLSGFFCKHQKALLQESITQ